MFTVNRIPPRVHFIAMRSRLMLAVAYINISKQRFSQRKSLLISQALGHLLRIPLTEAKKMRLVVLA